MRYDDASQAGSMASDSAPVARADVAALPPGSFGPENGNVITGAGTLSGAAGADSVGDAPTAVVEVHGAGGPTSSSGGSFQAVGQYGVLNMDAQGNFSYVRNAGTPEGVQDAFGYTIADKDGQTSSTTLAMNLGPAGQAAAVTIPGIINLPPGVELSDIRVSGRDLIITMPDGSQMVIPGGAVFVPQLVIGDVQVPPSNLAALLIESEPQPAAGQLTSSGGNFDVPVPPLDPGVPLGDLIPPTELNFPLPIFEEIGQFVDTEPTIDIQPDGQPASIAAVDDVFEAGLPARNGGEPEGSGEEAAAGDNGDPSEATAGAIHFTAEDGLDSLTIQGADGEVVITAGSVGTVIHGAQGDLTITGVNLGAGTVTYSYLLLDNTNPGGDGITDPFIVRVTDSDGDVASATLTINIHDDAPDARNDTDELVGNDLDTDGNVMTGAGTTSLAAGHDTVGADNATVTGAHEGGGTASFTTVPQDGSGVVIHGLFGDLTLHDDGSYNYVRSPNALEAGTEVFTYQLTDGDGDVDTATLTITLPNIDTIPEVLSADDSLVDEDGLANANVDNGQVNPTEVDSTESATDTGELVVDFKFNIPANLANAIALQATGLDGQLETPDGTPITFSVNGSGQLVGSDGTNDVIIISITGVTPGVGGEATYTYEVELLGPVQHTDPNLEDTITLTGVTFQITDSDGDHASGSFDVAIVDDVPTAGTNEEGVPGITLDESAVGTDTSDGTSPVGIATDTVDFSGAFSAPVFGADGEGSVTYSLALSAGPVGSGLYALDNADTTDGDSDGIGQGDQIMLVDNGDGTVSGVVGVTEYFTLSVDENTGEVTFTQLVNIWHPDTGNNDDAQSIVPDGGTLDLVQTVTDGDGDVDTASADLSGAFTIQDDGPDAVADAEPNLPQLVVDESPLPADGDGDNSATANFAAAFAAVLDFGTDGPGSDHYALILNGDQQAGIGSGLFALDASDTETVIDPLGQGAEIELIQNLDGSISGVVGTDVYFTISVDSDTGDVTLTRFDGFNLWHGDVSDADDSEILTAVAGTIQLQQTLTDADGDHDSAVVDLSAGVFVFEDDGPDADTSGENPPTITLDESPPPTAGDGDSSASADFSTLFATPTDFGTDGPGSAGYTLLLTPDGADPVGSGLFALDNTDTETVVDGYGQGDEILLVQTDSDTISGIVNAITYFTIDVDPDTGEVTFTQLQNIWHSDTGDNDDAETLVADGGSLEIVQTVTDADGDHDTASVDISGAFVIEDDGPSISDVAADSSISVDETTQGDINGWVTPLTATSADPMITATTSTGTDGLGSIVYGLALTGGVDTLASGLQTAQGDHAITLEQTNATTITGIYQDGGDQTAFTIVMNGDGTVTYTQNVPLEHSDDGSSVIAHNDTNSPLDFDGLIDATVTVTDADGDSATDSAAIGDRITVFDDGPTAIDPDPIVTENEAQSVITASLDVDDDVIDNFGADGPGAITFANITDGQDSLLNSGGEDITYWLSDDGQTVEGRINSTDGTDGTLVFTVHIDQANSEYEYTQFLTIDNGAGVEFSDLSGGVAGNPPFKLITEAGVTTELLASPINGTSINSDQDDMGVDSQFIDTTAGADKGIRIDFGDFTYDANAGGTSDDAFVIEDNSDPINGFKFTIDQVSNGTTADVHLKAIDADDDGGAEEQTPNPLGDTADTITSVEIFDNLGASIGVFTGDAVVGGITIDFNAGEVTIDNLPALYSIATFTADGYNRIEITNPGNDSSSDTDGKYSISNFSIETVNTGEPVNLNFDLQITDSDGDFVALPGAIDITLNVATADSLSLLSTTSSLSESSFDTSSLFANDNNGQHNRAFNTGSNSVLIGALAAAGLASDPVAASSNDSGSDQSVSDSPIVSTTSTLSVSSDSEDTSSSTSSDSSLLGDTGGKHESAPEHGPQSNDNGNGHDNNVSNEQAGGEAPSALPEGTDAPSQDGGSTPVTAAAIFVPSAEDLAGQSADDSSVGGNSQHNQVVGQVLADALHGGDSSNVEALINSLPSSGDHGQSAIEALASHGADAVPNGDTGVFAGFTSDFGTHIMEMAMHQDAAPSHA